MDQQAKRRGSFLMEMCLERVIETTDVLIDMYAARNIFPSVEHNTRIAKMVFRESHIMDMFIRLFKHNE
jgi:hypothetical protein